MALSYVLDTSVVLHLLRGQETGASIDAAFALRTTLHRHVVSIVSHGELRAMAVRNGWQEKKGFALAAALGELVTVDLTEGGLVDAYVQIAETCRKAIGGERKMGHNDIWIAATALYVGLPLITTDRDFLHLDSDALRVHWHDPDTRR